MLVIEEPGLIIRQASANAPARLGLTMDRILGRPLSTFMATTDFEHLRNCLKQESLDCTPMYLPPMQESTLFASLEASIHRIEGALVLELESWPDRAAVPDQEILTSIRSLLSFSTPPGTAARFCQRAAEYVRKFTGFDRVLVYRFDPDLSGHVMAEAKDDVLESYLDLHYPASDIPKQARDLLRRSKLRLVPNVDYASVPLQPALRPDSVNLWT